MIPTLRLFTAATLLLGAGAAHAQDQVRQPLATAQLHGLDQGQIGEVQVFDAGAGFLIRLNASGLEPGWHGFHMHETGDCGDDFQAAGSHSAPNDAPHGFFSGDAPHMGDLPNIHVDAQGEVTVDLHAEGILLDGEGGLLDEDGSAFIIHAQADDYLSADSAGGRVACGVIEASGT